MPANPKKFQLLLQKATLQAFMETCRKDEALVRESMAQYAMTNLPDSEHEKVKDLSSQELLEIVANMTLKNPEGWGQFMDILKTVVELYFSEDSSEE